MTESILGIIRDIYGQSPEVLISGLDRLMRDSNPGHSDAGAEDDSELWNESDVVLITYADQVRATGVSPIEAQRQFLLDHHWDQRIRCVHLLPFCPYSSDDGFSVIDYLKVDPAAGDWDDIARLGQSFDLMFDLVLNHSSQQHEWFRRFLQAEPEFDTAYVVADPNDDLSNVVRPRSLPLLTPFESATGIRHVWTTFSADQVDLNYADPRVLLRMIETIVQYAKRGARIIRLDAIAFLWKEPGTRCIHLPQTHAIVRLLRAVLDAVAPGTLVLTETNVPHAENVSYFGNGNDEAHVVYQFSLPPLLLDAIHSGDTTYLKNWLTDLQPPSDRCTFLNFTASHDGVGVRPLEGLVPEQRLSDLVETVHRHGGRVGMRTGSDGIPSPYELNISYVDAVADRASISPAEHSRRFLASQAVMLSLRGIPAVYFHSLVGSPNDVDAVEQTGINRRINRHKYERDELESALADRSGLQRRIFDGMKTLLDKRRKLVAFHPNADQRVLDLPTDGILGLVRGEAGDAPVVVIANLSQRQRMVGSDRVPAWARHDHLADEAVDGGPIDMQPFQVRWLAAK